VLVLQFIKGSWKSGEQESVRKLAPVIEIRQVGKGFVYRGEGPSQEDISSARDGLRQAAEALSNGMYGLVVLDEILYAIDCRLLQVKDVIEAVRSRDTGTDVVLTGRNAPDAVIELAQTVTKFEEVKHPFTSGIKARKGIEY
jgi:cob(I)alamin adenosyltransferase